MYVIIILFLFVLLGFICVLLFFNGLFGIFVATNSYGISWVGAFGWVLEWGGWGGEYVILHLVFFVLFWSCFGSVWYLSVGVFGTRWVSG